ncbi:5-dehydro-2-deoxygluconokinase [Castellaniella sp. GW247-6E4]|uniref:bifunctional 5-dehydro-2-deoxygluconokinase/5-dehydro-2- deoxyphosphogluconate aldolase n=1 Tax=Castellaniella sp. GW247-6E4 TaxID=3140380 RepID=UPI003315AD1B
MIRFNIVEGRKFDLVCLGRLAVDLYARQVGAKLEDVSTFSKYLGGSSANIAFGGARLGLRTAMLSRVGDEQMGRFLVETLANEGCDTSMIQVDPDRLTGLVLLGIKDRETFPLLFYRENCADMAIDPALISESSIADSRALLITGTHLSQPLVREASARALAFARRHGTFKVLDIDYRPVLWGLTKRGEGENRYVPDQDVTRSLQAIIPEFDLLIGTEEEFLIAGGVPHDLIGSLKALRAITPAGFVVKLGARGCCLIDGEVPTDIENAVIHRGEKVKVLNVLGAGDAFASGLLAGILSGKDFAETARMANACGAIVVSRHACAPAMPTPRELEYWLSKDGRDIDYAHLDHLHRTTARRKAWNELNVLAFDHRQQFMDLARNNGAGLDEVRRLKQMLVAVVERAEQKYQLQGKIGVLVDGGEQGGDTLCSITGRGWWLGRPVEKQMSRPLKFDHTSSVASMLADWPVEQVVKCLVGYHPRDEATILEAQEDRLRELWEATRHSGHELLLEIIPPADKVTADTHDHVVLESLERLYSLGIKPDWWKLSPMAEASWNRLAELIQAQDPYCRGVVLLGLNLPLDHLATSFRQARHPLIKGFMVGRSIWQAPSIEWLNRRIDDEAFIEAAGANFSLLIDAWRNRHTAVEA